MSRLAAALALLLAGLAAGRAAEPAALRVSNDGMFRASFTTGETTWSGACVVDHPRFHLELKGTVKVFGGPALRRTSEAKGSLKNAKFDTETQWISLVALGPGTVKLLDADGKPAVVTAQRVVYVPATDRLLLDGKPWQFPPMKL
ncbi:MAG: hypothetical protein RLZZ522_1058 [Verrucomicrobiota bacterium]